MRTMYLGPEELLVAAKFAVRTYDSAADVAPVSTRWRRVSVKLCRSRV